MSDIISRELLSAVLGFEVKGEIVITKAWDEMNGNDLEWEELSFDFISYPIHYIAHKCKEWAIKQGYKIRIDAHDYMEDDSFSGTYWWVNRLRPKTRQEEGCPNCGANSTEPEAIFKACQWILDNKEAN